MAEEIAIIPMVYQLDLPHPSLELISKVKNFVDTTTLNPSNKGWLDHFHNSDNSALHLFTLVDSITPTVQEEFGPYFSNTEIMAVIGIMKNPNSTGSVCQPPHIDRARALAVNYYIELGGDNVQTSFYDLEDRTRADSAQNFQYSQVKKIGHCIFDKHKWYTYNVSQCHSIENITGTRYFLSLVPKSNTANYKVTDLLKNPLIKGHLVNLWKKN